MSFITETSDEYNAREGVRATILKEILRSPAHAKQLIVSPRPATPQMELGILVHECILEPDKSFNYVAAPKFDRRTKEGKAAFADFEAANAGKKVVDAETFETISGCVGAVYAHPAAKETLCEGRTELTAAWTDDDFNLKCKARLDLYRDGMIVDVKTTSDASPGAFSRQIANLKYHVQAFHYLRAATEVTGITHDLFRIVAVETKPPYAVAVYELDFGTLEKAESEWAKAMGIYQQCTALDEWPSYSLNIQPIALPAWAFSESEHGY